MKQELIYEYNHILAQIEQLRQQAKKCANSIVHEGTREYFDKYEHIVHAITWQQFTPYFNDGETCEFSVNEPYALYKPFDDEEIEDYSEDSDHYVDLASYDIDEIKKRIATRAEYDNDPVAWSKHAAAEHNKTIIGSYRYSDDYYLQYPPESLTQEQLKQLLARAESTPDSFVKDTSVLMSTIISLDEDAMKELFGDHVQVIITREGVSTLDYPHY